MNAFSTDLTEDFSTDLTEDFSTDLTEDFSTDLQFTLGIPKNSFESSIRGGEQLQRNKGNTTRIRDHDVDVSNTSISTCATIDSFGAYQRHFGGATGAEQNATGAEQNATGAEQSIMGAEQNATGAEQSATGAEQNATGAEQSIMGAEDIATGAEQRNRNVISGSVDSIRRIPRVVTLVTNDVMLENGATLQHSPTFDESRSIFFDNEALEVHQVEPSSSLPSLVQHQGKQQTEEVMIVDMSSGYPISYGGAPRSDNCHNTLRRAPRVAALASRWEAMAASREQSMMKHVPSPLARQWTSGSISSPMPLSPTNFEGVNPLKRPLKINRSPTSKTNAAPVSIPPISPVLPDSTPALHRMVTTSGNRVPPLSPIGRFQSRDGTRRFEPRDGRQHASVDRFDRWASTCPPTERLDLFTKNSASGFEPGYTRQSEKFLALLSFFQSKILPPMRDPLEWLETPDSRDPFG